MTISISSQDTIPRLVHDSHFRFTNDRITSVYNHVVEFHPEEKDTLGDAALVFLKRFFDKRAEYLSKKDCWPSLYFTAAILARQVLMDESYSLGDYTKHNKKDLNAAIRFFCKEVDWKFYLNKDDFEKINYHRIFKGKPIEYFIMTDYDVHVLDGKCSSKLDWTLPESTKPILWTLDLGLFKRLIQPLDNETQFRCLQLSLDHFKGSVWPKYANRTLGVSIYSDTVLFDELEDDEPDHLAEWMKNNQIKTLTPNLRSLYRRDVCSHFLNKLVENVPDDISLHIVLDAVGITDLSLLAQLTNRSCFKRFVVNLINCSDLNAPDATFGVCLPSPEHLEQHAYAGLDQALKLLIYHCQRVRIIPESMLTAEWDGLDYMIYCPEGISKEGLRKLRGFAAAGGTILSLGATSNLPNEQSFNDYKFS